MSHEPYEAVFCPECGAHLNDVDLHDDPDEYVPNLGPLVTCGWCKLQTRDWGHIVKCRRTWKVKEKLTNRRVVDSLERILVDLDDENDLGKLVGRLVSATKRIDVDSELL